MSRKRLEPHVRLATRFIIVCYQHFELLERRAINLSLTEYADAFKRSIERGDLTEVLPEWFWRILSSRSRKKQEVCPFWPVAQAQAERFLEENRELIAERVLST
ncbi:MAG: hypothetical protein ACRD1Z_08765 [Vicinamibacteria bacterium]